MAFPAHVRCRRARAEDADRVAALHADSWRRHYRGAYSDAYLDGDVLADRRATWRARLRDPSTETATLVAEGGDLLGFAHVIFDADPRWGALLENLHVSNAQRGRGIGSRLIGLVAEAVRDRARPTGLHLWVLEQNTAARAFYQAHGGRPVESAAVTPPGGDPSRLTGTPTKLRYVWPDPSVLVPGRVRPA